MKLIKTTSICVTIVLIFSLFVIHAHAKVECNELKKNEIILWEAELLIFDEITADDPFLVQKCIDKYPSLATFLDSPGGDIDAAMTIGKILRTNRKSVFVKQSSQCVSACVLILAGAVNRAPYGIIGIHRPYSTRTGIVNFDYAQNKYQKIKSDVENYLRLMNIPASLFSAMERIPPEETKILTAHEIDAYGLSGMDPVENEVQNAYYADQRGVSIQEYIRRKEEAKRLCKQSYKTSSNDMLSEFDCREAVSWGLTTSVYNSRRMRLSLCDKDKMNYGLESREYNSCVREIMNGTK
ncbi:ATP-dependent Clp protease proteolytic subunit [Desulfofustis limnaeus]|uniref:Uncharacterized protein n=1 Tax=Desulfofustis limnaeus TaxID=2740163 RepID=A0ABM7WAP7_9BACT|nr:ATP-dependent Clp protease proteolytic subunit [Desulfofustis limnaeus]BDD88015.1 hypothetical protein DPPLL_23800 [Desulfofustis limnaeus]